MGGVEKNDPFIVSLYLGDPIKGAPHQIMSSIYFAENGAKGIQLCLGEMGKENRSEFGKSGFPIVFVSENKRGIIAFAMRVIKIRKVFSKYAKESENTIFYLQGCPALVTTYLAFFSFIPKKFIYHTQDFIDPDSSRLWSFFEGLASRKAYHVISNDRSRAKLLQVLYRLKREPFVIPTYLPNTYMTSVINVESSNVEKMDEYKYLYSSSSDNNTLLLFHPGPLVSKRCGAEIIDAIYKIESSKVILVTTGGDESFIEKQSLVKYRQLINEGRIIEFPNLNYRELFIIGSLCRIGLLFYRNDGIGNFFQCPGRLTEYMWMGLAILMSDFPSFLLLEKTIPYGVTCNSESSDAIAEKIERFVKDPFYNESSVKLSTKNYVSNNLSYEKAAHNIYKKIGILQ